MIKFAFVFARGGSKALPRKNIKLFCDRPLITYSINMAQQLSIFDEIFVSTDDKEIAEIAEKEGAVVIERPKELAQDDSPEWLAWQHAVDWVNHHYGEFDLFVSLPTTSPLRAAEDVLNVITKLQTGHADICIGVTRSARNPYFNMVKVDAEGIVRPMVDVENNISRRQDAPESFDITTVAYAAHPSYILENKSLFDGTVAAVEIPRERAIDIDDDLEFKVAELIFQIRGKTC